MSKSNKQMLSCMVIVIGATLAGPGCAVPQPRGSGKYSYVKEPSTNANYHLYLPVDYVKNNGKHPNPKINAWPLVMTFHGMKPYDSAHSQEREWEQEADIYGYIICAPELTTCDSFMEYPLTKEHDYVLKDRQNVISIMEHIYQTTNADRRRVLSTSWSCGGYFAHYFPNRFPDRFSCLATRLSNFSPSLLSEDTLPLYKDRVPVAIFIGDGDFAACKSESEEAVAWYESHGFRTVRGKMIDNIGHARIPQTCAAFFAEQLGIEPLHPLEAAQTVAKVRMTEYYPPQEMIARLAPQQRTNSNSNPVQQPVLASTTGTRKDTISRATPPRVMTPTVQNPQLVNTYMSSGAGRNYPDRAPLYEPPVSRQQLNANVSTPQRTATPAQPANATNGSPMAKTFPVEAQPASKQSPQSNAPNNSSRPVPEPARNDNLQLASAKNPSGRSNNPQTGTTPPKYSNSTPKFDANNAQSALGKQQPGKSYGVAAVPGLPKSGGNSPSSGSRASTGQTRVNKVGIRLNGPKVGASPHFIEYSVDMPTDKLDGADFLWMDNGVWMSADPSGKKVLQSPGMHQISVLLVTKDDVEYRGAATVQVLDPGPGGGAY